MPLYIGDYLGDTMRLTTEQHGAYLLMLMECWMTGPLPDDDEELSAVSRLPMDRWMKSRAKLARFFLVEGGLWRQLRVESEQQKAQKRRDAATENGKKGGRPRRNDKPSENPPVNPQVADGLSGSKPSTKAKANPQESSSPSPSPVVNPYQSDELTTEYLGPEKIWKSGS